MGIPVDFEFDNSTFGNQADAIDKFQRVQFYGLGFPGSSVHNRGNTAIPPKPAGPAGPRIIPMAGCENYLTHGELLKKFPLDSTTSAACYGSKIFFIRKG
jgi:hypothetical protein